MPFSTYLRDTPSSNAQRSQSSSTQQMQQQQYPGYGVYSDIDYRGYYTHPAPSPAPLNAHSSTSNDVSNPSSSSSTGVRNAANNGSSNKPYVPPSPSSTMHRTGSDGLFQMPSFLMGNFGGTLAPGGGAEVLTPSTLGMFDFVASPYAPAQNGGSGKQSSWQTTKHYMLDEQQHRETTSRKDDVASQTTTTAGHASTSTPSAPAHASANVPAASPFGYLNADSPQQKQQQQQQGEASSDDDEDDAASAAKMASPVEPEPASASSSSTAFHPPAKLYAPVPTAGLPVYSQSGFDMLSILARVARRPNQTISLGPVDLTCAFVVADVRRADAPVVYASRTFCELTGYPESEVIGRNCRFLQAPGGRVARSDVRFTSPEAVREMRFALDKDREVQVSLINYRKDGRPFVNRVSVVPIPAEDGASEIAFHVGFQVDLNEQPGLIAQRIQDGKFYSAGAYGEGLYKNQTPAERSARGMGKKLRALLSDKSFQSAVPLATSCNSLPSSGAAAAANNSTSDSSTPGSSAKSAASTGRPDTRDERQWLNLLLLEHMPDFAHVLSLKGHFLYVSPGITRVLGYAPADLIGKSVGDFCHPSDAVPLLRELKESTGQANNPPSSENNNVGGAAATPAVSSNTTGEAHDSQAHSGQRTVNLLFRMRTKAGGYTWIESIGRLHVEAGKGRKAIVLSGRMCAMPNLRWGAISQAGGLVVHGHTSFTEGGGESSAVVAQGNGGAEREFWAMLCEDGLFLVAGTGVRDLLGWGTAEMIGRSIREFIIDDSASNICASADQVLSTLVRAYAGEQGTSQSLTCRMKKRDGELVWMQLTLYTNGSRTVSGRVIVQFKLISSSPSSSPAPASAYQPYSSSNYMNDRYTFSYAPQSHSSYGYTLPDRNTSSGRILHAPSTNVFAEFETHRGTSWQYELQQLKFANDKLREEVHVLEARQRMRQHHQQQQHQQQHQHPHQHANVWVGNIQT